MWEGTIFTRTAPEFETKRETWHEHGVHEKVKYPSARVPQSDQKGVSIESVMEWLKITSRRRRRGDRMSSEQTWLCKATET